ncbi:hypothetical protein A9Q99_10900 [Gammaproteobacteria bacterium 45_16_T64]|nr:hypothetical protein A9Q99_10900 [Gammaproteobacteria bacterium 45_16_T64]
MSKKRVLYVDDSSSMQKIVQGILREKYSVCCAFDAQTALEMMDQAMPDACLLDIEMPSIDGYELARLIRKRHDGSAVPIIFLSGMNSEAVILKSYEAGGDDFITKPIVEDELKAKLSIALSTSEKARSAASVSKEVKKAKNVAFDAMRNAADIGQLLDYVQKTIACKSFDELGEMMLGIVDEYGLSAALELRTQKKHYQYSHVGVIHPLEQRIIDLFRKEKRMMDFNNRSLINYENVSILIKNMPLGDDNRYGQLKDVLATLAQASEPVIQNLYFRKQINAQRLKLLTMTEMVEESLKRVADLHKDNKYESFRSVDGILQDAVELFHRLNMTESCEHSIIVFFTDRLKTIEERCKQSDELDEELALILRALRETLGLITV